MNNIVVDVASCDRQKRILLVLVCRRKPLWKLICVAPDVSPMRSWLWLFHPLYGPFWLNEKLEIRLSLPSATHIHTHTHAHTYCHTNTDTNMNTHTATRTHAFPLAFAFSFSFSTTSEISLNDFMLSYEPLSKVAAAAAHLTIQVHIKVNRIDVPYTLSSFRPLHSVLL